MAAKKEDNPDGLHARYQLRKIDGSACAEGSEYLIFRVDLGGSDPAHVRAGRIAGQAYANAIQHHLPQVAADIRRLYPVAEAVAENFPAHDYQSRIGAWVRETFAPEVWTNSKERGFRFGEEAIELLQANGTSKEEVLKLVDYVFSRPVGELSQEIGGVMVTLASLCEAKGIDMQACATIEAARIERPEVREKIQAKQADKRARMIASPLPGRSEVDELSPAEMLDIEKQGGLLTASTCPDNIAGCFCSGKGCERGRNGERDTNPLPHKLPDTGKELPSTPFVFSADKEKQTNLVAGLSGEIERVAEIEKIYRANPNGELAAALMAADLKKGREALASGDIADMVAVFNELKGYAV